MANPKMLTDKFQPGLGIEHEVALENVGVTVVHTTVAANTARTAAELIASPPNTGLLHCVGPVVHSLGTAPALSFMTQMAHAEPTAYSGAVSFVYCTADNSAVYFWPETWTGEELALSVRVVAVR